MEKLKQLAEGMNNRFPKGNYAFQITTRLLEECGEVAKEVNRLEKSGTKVLRHGTVVYQSSDFRKRFNRMTMKFQTV